MCAFPPLPKSQLAYLYDAMTDGAVLPLPQKHQTDHNHSCYGHSDHQQANQCAAPKTEVLSQGAIGLLTCRTGESKTESDSEETIYAQLTTEAMKRETTKLSLL